MKHNTLGFILIFVSFMALPMMMYADDTWKNRTHMQVDQPGIIESQLPLELSEQLFGNTYDLTLLGPDNNSRAFELFWAEPVQKTSANVIPDNFSFKKDKAFEWVGTAQANIRADTIYIKIDEVDFIGKVTVDGFKNNQWVRLKKDETIFKTNDQSRMKLSITKGVYERVRLGFTGFNPKYKKKFAPVAKVELMGTKPGKERLQQTRRLKFKQIQTSDGLEIRAMLPGSGLTLKSVDFTTQAQFKGSWQIGFETINNGRQEFVQVKKGQIHYVSGTKQSVSINLGKKWQGKNLILKLDPRATHIGEIQELLAVFFVPRFVFLADIPGRYAMVSGKKEATRILEFPGDVSRVTDQVLEFDAPEHNYAWQPELLVEKFRIKGGPFDKKGYAWNALIDIAQKGFYRLILNQKASHEKNRSIRIVRDDIQIPFFFGNNELQEIDLSPYMKTDYFPDENTTQIHVKLPYASKHWSHLLLYSKGIFRRTVRFEIPKPGNMGWKAWTKKSWANGAGDETRLKVSM
ncbi:MAG: hypothetical protein GY729_06435, partial [Desulfobacteraceae bacterium]|nr:hypothetical protein [Desulfobacteraceae bacterium]